MNIPEIFKYNSLISIPLFALIALLLVKKIPDYSFSHHTISKSVLFLNNPAKAIIFRLNFLLKAFLDLGFALFILSRFQIPYGSFTSLVLILSACLFGTLAYFVEGEHSTSHKIATYLGGVLWVTGQFTVVRIIDNSKFTIFSIIFLSIPIFLAFGYLFAKKTNVFIQAICMSIWYVWLLVFVFRYL